MTIKDYSSTAASNTTINSISIAGTAAVSNMDDGLRNVMSDISNWTDSDTLASGTTTDLGSVAGMYVTVSGTATITGFGTLKAGMVKFVYFSGAGTITYNATSMILPGGASISRTAGDTAIFVSEGSGNWRCISYSPLWDQVTSWVSVSGSPANIDFTGLTAGTHKLFVEGLRPAVDSDTLRLRVQTGGVTWQATGYLYAANATGVGAATANYGSAADGTTASVGLSRVGAGLGVGNATGEGWSGEITFNPALNDVRRVFKYDCGWILPDGALTVASGYGSYSDVGAITGVRLFFTGSNFENVGRYRLLKMRG